MAQRNKFRAKENEYRRYMDEVRAECQKKAIEEPRSRTTDVFCKRIQEKIQERNTLREEFPAKENENRKYMDEVRAGREKKAIEEPRRIRTEVLRGRNAC